VVEPVADMPPGTLGLRVDGKLTRADYTEVLEPALKEAFGQDEVRLLCEIEPGFGGLEAGAVAEDLKTAFRLMIGEKRHRWKRTAIVTNIDWIRRATEAFAWMAPGEMQVFPLTEHDAARAWVAG
jgi:SpoIIAA-like